MYTFITLVLAFFLTAAYAHNQSLAVNEAEGVSGENLPLVGTYENMKKLLEKHTESRDILRGGLKMGAAPQDAMESVSQNAATSAGTAPRFSETNIQVKGVDESDLVKTDGEYIYQVVHNQVKITRALPASQMELASTITFDDKNFSPRELYVDSKHLLVIGSSNHEYWRQHPEPEPAPLRVMPPYWNNSTRALVYDISNKKKATFVREVELEGSYLTSRKIGPVVYLLSNSYINYPHIEKPFYRDTLAEQALNNIDYDQIRYFPGCYYPNYLLVAAFDLDKKEEAVVNAYLGSGNNIYMSGESLYVSVARDYRDTAVYKFNVKGAAVDYQGQAVVPGTPLNQFSMDEHKGHFRIATTDFSGRLKNGVYILDNKMQLTGKIENIAPNERIYSARFMGDKGYLVTFEIVDPLFVLDLSDPAKPEILGELKIPGFSNYLHPLDDTHLLGIGKDTVAVDRKDHTGRVVGPPMVYELGIKLAIFDVSDVNNPREKYVEIIGDRGTYSEVLHNHKALLFDQRNNLLAFPVTIMKSETGDINSYGYFTFQGAVVYGVDLVKGFKLKGQITHMSGEDYRKAGYYYGGEEKSINRLLYIDQNLYSLSNSQIQANNLNTLEFINKLEF
jgi:uncharacterized secreted protein with C-terminal beta-propeller domain